MSHRPHTPGPWLLSRRSDGNIELTDHEGNVLATFYGDDSDPSCWPVTANATVGAAAPETAAQRDRLLAVNAELVAAVGLVMEKSGHFYDCLPGKRGQQPSDDCSHVCQRIRATLAKALTKSD